jgi:transcriptional regulator with XRE-family HTH domain
MAATQRDSPNIAIDGAKLRLTRQLRGTGVVLLAERAGVSHTYIGQLERGERERVSPAVYAKICDALGVTDRTELMAATTPKETQ